MSEPETSDAELIVRAQAGEVDAYGELYQRYLDPIYRYIRSRVGDDQDAEDLCEMVFLRSFESLAGYRERGHAFSAYLYQVARNHLVDHYRKSSGDESMDLADDLPGDIAGPEAQVENRERALVVAQALGQLSADYQEVIRLRVILGLPASTVGEWMGKSPGAVRVLLHRALRALRTQVGDEEG